MPICAFSSSPISIFSPTITSSFDSSAFTYCPQGTSFSTTHASTSACVTIIILHDLPRLLLLSTVLNAIGSILASMRISVASALSNDLIHFPTMDLS